MHTGEIIFYLVIIIGIFAVLFWYENRPTELNLARKKYEEKRKINRDFSLHTYGKELKALTITNNLIGFSSKQRSKLTTTEASSQIENAVNRSQKGDSEYSVSFGAKEIRIMQFNRHQSPNPPMRYEKFIVRTAEFEYMSVMKETIIR